MRARGNQLPHARLTPETVREIRVNREGMSDANRAKKLGVHLNTVIKARKYETWCHIK
jgi:hypothetical protein